VAAQITVSNIVLNMQAFAWRPVMPACSFGKVTWFLFAWFWPPPNEMWHWLSPAPGYQVASTSNQPMTIRSACLSTALKYGSIWCTPHMHLAILIFAQAKASLISFLRPCFSYHITQLLTQLLHTFPRMSIDMWK